MSSPYDNLVPDEPVAPPPTPSAPDTPTPEPESKMKSIFKSKTIWVNLIAGAGTLITMLMNSEIVAQNPEFVAYGTTALAVINLVLRMVTKEPVSVTGK